MLNTTYIYSEMQCCVISNIVSCAVFKNSYETPV
uniref:Uncharacterized protein n=1 Tax=Arundo donax TaxID=35708 RepID=A0A0A9HPE5_ARUDO